MVSRRPLMIPDSEPPSPEAALTPKQRMAARKQAEADQRAQEVKDHMQDSPVYVSRQLPSDHKLQMVRGSLQGGGASVALSTHSARSSAHSKGVQGTLLHEDALEV